MDTKYQLAIRRKIISAAAEEQEQNNNDDNSPTAAETTTAKTTETHNNTSLILSKDMNVWIVYLMLYKIIGATYESNLLPRTNEPLLPYSQKFPSGRLIIMPFQLNERYILYLT
jgi:hypothetical protein